MHTKEFLIGSHLCIGSIESVTFAYLRVQECSFCFFFSLAFAFGQKLLESPVKCTFSCNEKNLETLLAFMIKLFI